MFSLHECIVVFTSNKEKKRAGPTCFWDMSYVKIENVVHRYSTTFAYLYPQWFPALVQDHCNSRSL